LASLSLSLSAKKPDCKEHEHHMPRSQDPPQVITQTEDVSALEEEEEETSLVEEPMLEDQPDPEGYGEV
jgi:hypothetical protein